MPPFDFQLAHQNNEKGKEKFLPQMVPEQLVAFMKKRTEITVMESKVITKVINIERYWWHLS